MVIKKPIRVILLFASVILCGNIKISYAKTADQCWRTAGDPSVAEKLFYYEEPSIFLSKMLEEVERMRDVFPVVSEQEEKEYKTLFDRKYRNKNINQSDNDRFVVLDTKRKIDSFIANMRETLSYQSGAKDRDILGYLFAVNILEESRSNDLVVSFMVAESLSIGATSKSELASYISNVGYSYISGLSKHILLCIIPKSL